MAGRVGGLPDLAAVRGVLLHEGRVAGHLAALHRLARRAVPVDPARPTGGKSSPGSSISTRARSGPGPFTSPVNRGSAEAGNFLLSGSRTETLTAPATTCAAVSTVPPRTMKPDPYRYPAESPRQAITSTTRARSGTSPSPIGLPLRLAGDPRHLHGPSLPVDRLAEHHRDRLPGAALPASAPAQLQLNDGNLETRLPLQRPGRLHCQHHRHRLHRQLNIRTSARRPGLQQLITQHPDRVRQPPAIQWVGIFISHQGSPPRASPG